MLLLLLFWIDYETEKKLRKNLNVLKRIDVLNELCATAQQHPRFLSRLKKPTTTSKYYKNNLTFFLSLSLSFPLFLSLSHSCAKKCLRDVLRLPACVCLSVCVVCASSIHPLLSLSLFHTHKHTHTRTSQHSFECNLDTHNKGEYDGPTPTFKNYSHFFSCLTLYLSL